MQKLISVVGSLPLSLSATLAAGLAGGLSVALISFKEFAHYLLVK